MPGTVNVKVVRARDLPVMDKRSELTDAFVEIKLGSAWNKTEVCPKTLHPKWNSQWFKFNVTDEELQDEPLQLKVMDRDLYSAHDAIGRVYIVLNPLIECGSTHTSLEGWFPIFDTLHGVRGELFVQVKLELIQDQQRFKQSSFGVQFYSCTGEPEGMAIHCIHGFIEELVVNDDPEYQWIDRLRTPRSSNEARQRLFTKLSGELRRRIGGRALEVEANAVLGYQQSFDIEGESGLVVRGIGTCVSLVPKPSNLHVPIPVCFPATLVGVRPPSTHVDTLLVMMDEGAAMFDPVMVSPQHSMTAAAGGFPSRVSPPLVVDTTAAPPSSSPCKSSVIRLVDQNLATSSGSGAAVLLSTPPPPAPKHISPTSEYPFFTITTLPNGVLTHVGGLVTARSVKLLDKINNPDDPETRDVWWREVRDEMRSHLRVLGCSVAIGYSEHTSICDSLCIFSATGTAVTVTETVRRPPTSPGSEGDVRKEAEVDGFNTSQTDSSPVRVSSNTERLQSCSVCHLPYSTGKLPIDVKATFCRICRSNQVPSIILSTSSLPANLLVRGRGCLVQARYCVAKRKARSEENAFKVSKELPFLEYELHNRLLNKVYVCGMNAVFGLRVTVTVAETVIIGLATGTAVYLEALPPPPQLHFQIREGTEKTPSINNSPTQELEHIQLAVNNALKINKEAYGLLQSPSQEVEFDAAAVATAGSNLVGVVEDLTNECDLTAGKKDVFLVDLSEMRLSGGGGGGGGGNLYTILDRRLADGFHLSNLSTVPGVPITMGEEKMVTMVRRTVFQEQRGSVDKQFSSLLSRMIQVLCFKVRSLRPCVITDVRFDIDLPEEDDIQVSLTAVVARCHQQRSKVNSSKQQTDDCMFDMEEGGEVMSRPDEDAAKFSLGGGKVIMSSASFVSGWSVGRYIGRTNIFFIRETTSLRESGGLAMFLDLFLMEANSIVRANVRAVGGNAILNYQLNKCTLIDHLYKNQAHCLLDISGDTVQLTKTSFPLPPPPTDNNISTTTIITS